MKYFKVFMDIDEQLINQNTSDNEAEQAGDFREIKRGNEAETANSLREAVQQKKNQNISKESGDQKILDSKPAINPILAATDESLKGAWTNLLPSWGLTLIWIDIHAFLNKVFGPTVFRDLGEEWVPDNIKKLGGEKTKIEAAMLRTFEGAGCGCLNLGCLFVVIAILSLVALIVSGISSPLVTLKIMLGSLWDYLTK